MKLGRAPAITVSLTCMILYSSSADEQTCRGAGQNRRCPVGSGTGNGHGNNVAQAQRTADSGYNRLTLCSWPTLAEAHAFRF